MEDDSASFASNEANKENGGMEVVHCKKCRRLLKTKESVERGIGPVCLKRVQALSAAPVLMATAMPALEVVPVAVAEPATALVVAVPA